jgi:two-component system, sensor histidine kinase and response regulator
VKKSTSPFLKQMSLHSFLIRLIWLCVSPLVVLAAYLAISSIMSKQAERDLEAANLAKSFAIVVDQHLDARIGALHMLAGSPLVDDASRWEDLYREAQGFHESFGNHVVFADLEMRMLFNTRVPFGTRLPMLPRPKGYAAAPAAVETGKPAVGDIFPGPIAKEPLVAIAVPALREGTAAYLLLTIFETRRFQERLDQVALPSGWSLTLLDGNHEPIARRVRSGLVSEADVDAQGRFVVRSTVSPWSVVLEIPRDIYRKSLIEAAAVLAIAVLGATLASILGGLLASRRLGRSVASLAQTPAPGAPAPDIAEIAAVRHLLDESAERRETAEAARRESEQRLRATFELAAVGISLVAPDGRWLRVNQKLCDIVGYSQDELLTKKFQDITHPDDLDAELACMRQMLAGEIETYSMEKRYLRKDGSLGWINLTVALVWKADATPDYFISVIEDIQAGKQAEEALRESEEKYRLLVESIRKEYLIYRHDVHGVFTYLSPSVTDILGHSMAEFKAHYRTFMTDNPINREVEHYTELCIQGIPQRPYAVELWHKDGSTRLLEVAETPLFDRDGKVVAVQGIAHDITERKRAEEALQEERRSLARQVEEKTRDIQVALEQSEGARDRIDAILKSIGDGLVVMDAQQRVLSMNRSAEEMLGVQLSDLIGQPLELAIEEETLRAMIRDVFKNRTADYRFDLELRGTAPDRHLVIEAHTSVVRDKKGMQTGIVMSLRDVTYQREVERMKTEFLSTAAHELRTPLTSIRGFSELLLTRNTLSQEEKTKFLGYINRQAVALTDIINDLLDITRIESGKGFAMSRSWTRVSDRITQAVAYFQDYSPRHRFEVSLEDRDVQVYLDPDKIDQVLKNILSNAVKYSGKGVSIRVSGGVAGEEYRFSVEDEGIGLTPEQRARIFEKFYRADASDSGVGGTGLGMAIVKYIVEAHGGRVWAESEGLGRGVKVSFSIPIKAQGVPGHGC